MFKKAIDSHKNNLASINSLIANRSDGLGERLNSIFNALLLSEITKHPFFFAWPVSYVQSDAHHAVESVEEIFSQEFIAEFFISPPPITGIKDLKIQRGTISEIRDQVIQQLDRGSVFVPQISIFPLIDCQEQEKKELARIASSKMMFSKKIASVREYARTAASTENAIAIHIRAGDIVYGRFSENPSFLSKTICAPLAAGLARRMHSEGKSIYLFGQEQTTASLLINEGVVQSWGLEGGRILDKLEVAFLDIFLMNQCKSIVAGSSGFARIAAQMKGMKPNSYRSLVTDQEAVSITLEELASNSEFFSSEQRGYSYFFCSEVAGKSNFASDAEICRMIEKAVRENPGNSMYRLIHILRLLAAKKIEEADRYAKELLDRLLSQGPDFFAKSRARNLFNMREKHSNESLFVRYAPDLQSWTGPSPALTAICESLLIPPENTSAKVVYSRLAKGLN